MEPTICVTYGAEIVYQPPEKYYLSFMKLQHKYVIAGAGGIAEAAGLLLLEWSEQSPELYIGNRTLAKARKVAKWIENGCSKAVKVHAFKLDAGNLTGEMKAIFNQADMLLDCLPGAMAPKMAHFAREYQMHYANLTEYVAETEEIKALAKRAKTAFVLQTGLAPGYINVLAHGLFRNFCADFGVEKADKVHFKVGALTTHAVAPHYYGFTWSPVGVATEYLKNAMAIRESEKTNLLALSERASIVINGITYEEAMTSGGAADLPDALAGKVRSLDYKTLRHPGHYAWVEKLLSTMGTSPDLIADLQQKMEAVIPHVEDDQVLIYAAVEGTDHQGILRRREVAKTILPQKVGKHTLRAIQLTTAAPLLQSARMLFETPRRGVVLQSEIEPHAFLNGYFIKKVYGEF